MSIIVYTSDRLTSLLIYDRLGIMNAEVWRLFSSPFVHLSFSHLFFNVTAFIFLAYFIEQKNKYIFLFIVVFSILFNGIMLFIFDENMLYYGGISGINYAFMFYLLLSFPYLSKTWKLISQFILTLLIVKVFIELCGCSLTLGYLEKESFRVSSLSHAFGILSAWLVYMFEKRKG